MYVCQSLNPYRRFEAVVGWSDRNMVGNMVIIANKNASLPMWLIETYKVYNRDRWQDPGPQSIEIN